MNGQWMPPNGQPLYHYNMRPSQGFQPMAMQSHMMMAHRQNGANPMAHFAAAKQDQHAQHHPVTTNGTDPSMAPHANPTITSIRPSEITKKQIEGLRSSLRYYEDQLQYNRHQIDEKAT